jgi:hypothetical protein
MIDENEGSPDDQSAHPLTRTSVLATLKNRKFIERQIENLDRMQ